MSLSVILDHLGKINLNGSCCNNISTIYDIPNLKLTGNPNHIYVKDENSGVLFKKDVTAVESRINMYHLSQFIFDKKGWSAYINEDYALRGLVSDLKHGGLGLLTFSYYNSSGSMYGHAVVAYGKPQQLSSERYEVKIYDPNSSSRATLRISTPSIGSWSGVLYSVNPETKQNVSYAISTAKFESNFSQFDDNGFNPEKNPTDQVLALADEYADMDIIVVCATGDFTVTNAEGASFHYADEQATGDMDIFGKDLVVFSSNIPCATVFLVEKSESFSCTADEESEIVNFVVATHDAAETGQGADNYE